MLTSRSGKGWVATESAHRLESWSALNLSARSGLLSMSPGGLKLSYFAILTMDTLTVNVVFEEQQTKRNYQTIN